MRRNPFLLTRGNAHRDRPTGAPLVDSIRRETRIAAPHPEFLRGLEQACSDRLREDVSADRSLGRSRGDRNLERVGSVLAQQSVLEPPPTMWMTSIGRLRNRAICSKACR